RLHSGPQFARPCKLTPQLAHDTREAFVERIPLLVPEERRVVANVLQFVLKEAVALVDPRLRPHAAEGPTGIRLGDEHVDELITELAAEYHCVLRKSGPRRIGKIAGCITDGPPQDLGGRQAVIEEPEPHRRRLFARDSTEQIDVEGGSNTGAPHALTEICRQPASGLSRLSFC